MHQGLGSACPFVFNSALNNYDDVSRSREINYFVKFDLAQVAYIRHGATNVKLPPPEMKAMIEAVLRSIPGGINVAPPGNDTQ
jgi:hypothetical protein